MSYNWRQAKAIEQSNKKRWLSVNGMLTENSGIYIMTRVDEGGFKYAYIGQAKHLLSRLAQHLVGYQHIDLSLKKHGLHSETKPFGWRVTFEECDESKLDRLEQYYIEVYGKGGYILRNKTTGSQGTEKRGLDNNENTNGYRRGVAYGYEKCRKEVAVFFEKYLDIVIKGETNKIKERKYAEFIEYLKGEHNGN